MAGESIASLLNNVWAAFCRAGITDDLRIIEQTAALLREQEGVTLDSSPPDLSVHQEVNLNTVCQQLQDAGQQAGGAGVLFDRSILFRLDTMRPGRRYPTPQHIVRLMTVLAETAKKLPPMLPAVRAACSSTVRAATLVGMDIAPKWARIARANLQLHEKPGGIQKGMPCAWSRAPGNLSGL